jgi:quinol monooxygenase YgiN
MKDTPQAGHVVMTALLSAKPDKREELHQALCSLVEGIQKQSGCLDCMVGQDLVGEPRFHLYLVWKDRRALESFVTTDLFRILLGAMNVLAAPTEFRISAAEDTFSPTVFNKETA